MANRALIARRDGDGSVEVSVGELQDSELGEGDVTVAVEYSTVNYKDGLAITNAAPIIQSYPLVPGIDLAGTVIESSSLTVSVGDRVVVNGWGMGATHNGGFAAKARIPSEWAIPLADSVSTRHAAAIGTAGYTAMLAVLALEHGGVRPEDGTILVTGASGGSGSVAVALLARLGYKVAASTGRPHEAEYLRSLGAHEIVDRATLSEPGRPIGAEKWAGAIDSVGSTTLANILAQVKYGGVVAAFGMASGNDLPASVLPFILRGVTLAGIDSVNAPRSKREEAWSRLAVDLDLDRLDAMVTEIGLADVPGIAGAILRGKVKGRTLVDLSR